jgi:hypothetical protein
MQKAIFLGISKFHSNNKNQDYRQVNLYTPPFKDKNGFTRGGVEQIFTDVNSTIGSGLKCGAIVEPQFEYDHYSRRDELIGLELVQDSPYNETDFQ